MIKKQPRLIRDCFYFSSALTFLYKYIYKERGLVGRERLLSLADAGDGLPRVDEEALEASQDVERVVPRVYE